MPEDLYSDAAPAAPAEAEPTAAEPEEQKEETSDNEATAELPKSVLGGKEFKPGEEVVLQVVQVMENSVLVKYASEEGGKGYEEETKEKPEPAAAGGNPGGGSYMY